MDTSAETGSGQTSSIRQVELIASYGYQAVALYMAGMAFVTVISVVLATRPSGATSSEINPRSSR